MLLILIFKYYINAPNARFYNLLEYFYYLNLRPFICLPPFAELEVARNFKTV